MRTVRPYLWALWTLVPLLNWVGFAWAGYRTRSPRWIVPAVAYFAPLPLAVIPATEALGLGSLLLTWVLSIFHGFLGATSYAREIRPEPGNDVPAPTAWERFVGFGKVGRSITAGSVGVASLIGVAMMVSPPEDDPQPFANASAGESVTPAAATATATTRSATTGSAGRSNEAQQAEQTLSPATSSSTTAPTQRPTVTPAPPTATNTARSTDTPKPTATPIPPTATPIPPTATAVVVNTCGAPSNPFGYQFCGGSVITSPPNNFCSYFNCIASFWNGRGYVMQCGDGTFGKSGGISGSCSGHGGNSRALYQ